MNIKHSLGCFAIISFNIISSYLHVLFTWSLYYFVILTHNLINLLFFGFSCFYWLYFHQFMRMSEERKVNISMCSPVTPPLTPLVSLTPLTADQVTTTTVDSTCASTNINTSTAASTAATSSAQPTSLYSSITIWLSEYVFVKIWPCVIGWEK